MAKPHTEVAKKKPGKTSSYMMFFQEKRPIIIERFPSKTFTEISKIAGHLWKELTEVEKDEYKRKADVFNGEKLQRWAMENSSNQGSPVAKKAATPRKQKGEDSTGTSSGNISRLARQSQGWSFQPQFIICYSSMFLLKDMANFQNFWVDQPGVDFTFGHCAPIRIKGQLLLFVVTFHWTLRCLHTLIRS